MTLRAYIRTVVRYSPAKVTLLVVFMALAGVMEGISFTLFLPLIQLMAGPQSVSMGGVEAGFAERTALYLGHRTPLGLLLVLILAAFGLKNIFLYFQKWYAARLSLEFERDTKRGIIESYFQSGWRFYLNEKAGVLVNAVGTQAKHAADAFRIFSFLAFEILNVAIYCAIGLALSPSAFVVSLAAGGVSFFILRNVVGKTRVIGREALDIKNDISGQIVEDFSGIKFLKGNRFEPLRQKRLFASFEKLMAVESRGERFAALMDSLPDFIMACVVCLILYFSHTHFQVPGERLLVLIMVLYRMNRRLMTAQSYRQRLYLYLPSFELCHDLIRRAEEHREVSGNVPFERLSKGIVLDSVNFAYGARPVLQSLSMEIPKNSLIAVVGRSGGGKTTLMDVLMGLLKPQSGSVKINGKELGEYDLFSWRRKIGFVPQEVMLVNGTIEENIRMGDDSLSEEAIRRAATQAYAHDFIQEQADGYKTLVGDRGLRLSGGQRQRIALARALAKQPEVLILDEATSALDQESERMVQKTIEALKGKMTLIAVAHRLSTVECADRICVMEDGRIAETGSPADLKKNSDSFKTLYELH